MSRVARRRVLRRVASAQIPTRWGAFQTIGFERETSDGSGRVETALAVVLGDLTKNTPLLRIHSQCFTGEVLGSFRCDCGEQLDKALDAIAAEGRGLLIYEHQEGRGIGLMAKLQAYALQDEGLDTVEANHALGFDADHRDFSLSVDILRDLGINRVRLLTNNPNKSNALIAAGVEVNERLACEVAANSHSLSYLQTKKEKMGHALTLERRGSVYDPTSEAFGGVSCDFVDGSSDAGRTRSAKPHEQTPTSLLDEQAEEQKAFGVVSCDFVDLPFVEERTRSTRSHEQTRSPNFDEQAEEQFEFASIEDAIQELRAGRMIVVVDDEDRENEGDLTIAAEMITPEAVNFMATHGRGLICLAMNDERLQELELEPMSPANSALGGTAFTVSIDVKGDDVTTGISAYDRAQTIKAAVDPNSQPEDFARPGHVFPLCARAGGVLERRGQTEAAVDLASLAGLQPAGVICEIVNDDGTMSRVPDLIRFCQKHGLLMITVADLARYRFDLDYEGILEAQLLGAQASPPARVNNAASYLQAELLA